MAFAFEVNMATGEIEVRLSTLEKDVAQLKQQVGRGQSNWLERIVGSMKDEPDFDKVIQLGRDFRNQDRPQDDQSS